MICFPVQRGAESLGGGGGGGGGGEDELQGFFSSLPLPSCAVRLPGGKAFQIAGGGSPTKGILASSPRGTLGATAFQSSCAASCLCSSSPRQHSLVPATTASWISPRIGFPSVGTTNCLSAPTSSLASARPSRSCGACRLISSPSKSALKAAQFA